MPAVNYDVSPLRWPCLTVAARCHLPLPCPALPPSPGHSAVRTMWSPRAAARSLRWSRATAVSRSTRPTLSATPSTCAHSRLPGTGPRMPSCLCRKDRNPPRCARVGAAAGFYALVMELWRALCITRLCDYAPYERRSSIMLCRLWRLDSTRPYVDGAAVTGQTARRSRDQLWGVRARLSI